MFVLLICLIFTLKLFCDLTRGKCISKKRLDGKTIILTGANSGIGFETLRNLAERGARIIMACRNINEGLSVKDKIIQETGNKNIILMYLDISSLKSIRNFVAEILKYEKRLDILIHNAGISSTNDFSIDGLQLCLTTNLFGIFLLTILLIDLMKRTTSSRIIFVSSGMAFLGSNINFNLMNEKGEFLQKIFSYYSVSKYGLLLLSNEFSRKLRNTKISVNSLHPGLIRTKMIYRSPRATFFFYFIKFLTKSPEEGSHTTVHLCVEDNIKNVTGKFFIDCKEFEFFTNKKHLENASVLWKKCEQIVQLTKLDPKI